MSSIPKARHLRTAWSVAWRVVVFFLIWAVFLAPFFVMLSGKIDEWNRTNPVIMRLCGDAWVVVSLLAATWLMARFIDRGTIRDAGIILGNIPRDLAGGLSIGVVWLALPLTVAWMSRWIMPVDHGPFPWGDMPLAALAMLVNVIAQQLLLCGYLFAMVRSRAGLIAALVVSGILFTAYHAAAMQGHWLPALNVFATATLFCLAREVSGGLSLPVGIHLAWNFLLGPVLGLTVSGKDELGEGWRAFEIRGPDWGTGGGFGFEGSALVICTTVAIVTILLAVLRRTEARGTRR